MNQVCYFFFGQKTAFELFGLMLLFRMVGIGGIVPLIGGIRLEITKQFLCYYERIQASNIIVMSPCPILYEIIFTLNLLKKEVSCSFKAREVASKSGFIILEIN